MRRCLSLSVRRTPAFLAAAITVVVVGAPTALAGTCAPPGNSGVNQYVEVVPGAGCNQPPAGPGSSSGGHSGSGHLSTSTTQTLNGSGAAGRAVVALVGSPPATSSGSRGRSHAGKGQTNAGPGANPSSTPSTSGSNPVSAILHPILTGSGSDGLGVLLPVLLLGVVLGTLLAGLIRRRRVST
jgi:hypothetical protein